MRSQALEWLGETERKANEDCERKAKRQQRSGADVTEFPRENSEKELKIRQEELALNVREVENEYGFFTTTITTNTSYDGVVIETCEKVYNAVYNAHFLL